MINNSINSLVSPEGSLDMLSQLEINKLRDASQGGLYKTFKRCSFAVLNVLSNGDEKHESENIFELYEKFNICIIQQTRGIKLEVKNAPKGAFIDGEMIKGVKDHLFSVLRDIVYISNEIENNTNFNLKTSEGITNAVFHILRNAGIFKPRTKPNLVVCWGGHSINEKEYLYSREVGYELGLRGLNVCTGCGSGAMKGPMKGATIGHAIQRIKNNRYIGITEPGIISDESPNPIVNDLVIMPDIEKRLEAFVRIGHGLIVFPGGVGTTEEIFYLLGILLNPENENLPFPLFFTGPSESKKYFQQIDTFIGSVLGSSAQKLYTIVIGNPKQVAMELKKQMDKVLLFRKNKTDAFYFNWQLKIEKEFQLPFKPTHKNMENLKLFKDQKPHVLAANVRKAFSGILSANIKEEGIMAIKRKGPFLIHGDPKIMTLLDELIKSFAEQNRIKINSNTNNSPWYRIVQS